MMRVAALAPDNAGAVLLLSSMKSQDFMSDCTAEYDHWPRCLVITAPSVRVLARLVAWLNAHELLVACCYKPGVSTLTCEFCGLAGPPSEHEAMLLRRIALDL